VEQILVLWTGFLTILNIDPHDSFSLKLDLLSKANMTVCKPCSTPISAGFQLDGDLRSYRMVVSNTWHSPDPTFDVN